MAPYADRRRVDAVLRLVGGRALPIGASHERLAVLGLPSDVAADALRRVRRVADWVDAWTWAAQRFLGESRIYQRAGEKDAAALYQRHAALAYHIGAALVFDDPRTLRALRASASSLYARSLPVLHPDVRPVRLPWRTKELPGYLVHPAVVTAPAPLVVLLNGSSTSKEEMLLWSDAFLQHGQAVLALDWPGSGESALTVRPVADGHDFTEGIVALAEADPELDSRRIALVGFSLGGAVAGLAAASDRRIGAIVAVTPPYDARPWLANAQPLLRRHLVTMAGGRERATRLASAYALPGVIERARCPVLVIGAGRDLVVPPDEAIRYCIAAAERGTLIWYPRGAHGLYDALPEWTADAASWIDAALAGSEMSTWVDQARAAPAGDPGAGDPLRA
ncbi:MAG: alpha/beta fold hydrolase [Thermomicrobiales bacterium]|nr:alpha/beta fold hydrolase [Thermomicrobiales bacterium]